MISEATETFAEIGTPVNPFPGLRPFEFDESHLFFGRDGQSEQLISKLGRTRFLAVVGTSGSGKSSLVRAGLLPTLLGGFMTSAGSDWRIAIMRPGSDPIGNLAEALNSEEVFGSEIEENAAIQTAIAEATLRRGNLGLVDAVRQAAMPENENLLVLVDQFEEIFRFARVSEGESYHNDAAAFVKLILEASRQREVPIYVVLTMRSDYLGDCSQFWDLPEAINESQYLIPRLTRDQLREAITGPAAVGLGSITPRLINRLLNDVGDDQDQLPILQHALMRTWDKWKERHQEGEPLDLPGYEAIGTMSSALSDHADEAYAELPNERSKEIAEKIFKGLTEKGADNREVRRPIELKGLCALAETSEAEVVAVIDVFRKEGRSFLMPPSGTALTGVSLIDISHESLIRNWKRLKEWVEQESRSARIYRRLAETAVLYGEGGAGLWRDPDLQIALTWREQTKPNQVWAQRYHPEFAMAMKFLDDSVAERNAQIASEEARRKKEIKRTRITALIFLVATVFSLAMGVYAYGEKNEAASALAEANRQRVKAEEAQEKADHQALLASEAQTKADIQTKVADEAKFRANNEEEAARISAAAAEKAKNEARANAKKASDRAEEAVSAAKVAVKQIGENRRLLYSSNIGIAQKALQDNNSQRSHTLLSGLSYEPSTNLKINVSDTVLTDDTGDLRGFEWYYLWGLANRKLTTFKTAEGAATPKTDQPVASSPEPGGPVTPVASAAGAFVIGGSDGIARLWFGDSPPLELPQHDGPVTSVAISPKGDVFATADRTTVKIWTFENRGQTSPSLKKTINLKGNGGGTALAFSPLNGKYLAVGSRGTFMLFDVDASRMESLVEGGEGTASVCFVENGKTLITCDGPSLTRWDVATQRRAAIKLSVEKDAAADMARFPKSLEFKSVAFTPDGRTMATTSANRFYDKFMVWTATNDEGTAFTLKALLPAHKNPALSRIAYDDLVIAISPDGKYLATGDGADLTNGGGVKVWNVDSLTRESRFNDNALPRELFTLGPGAEYPTWLAFSDSSKVLAVSSAVGVQLWDVSEKEQSRSVELLSSSKAPVLFSPDRKSMVLVNQDEATLLNANEVGDANGAGFSHATATRWTTLAPSRGDLSKDIPVAISPDNQILATREAHTEAQVLTLWSVQTNGVLNLRAKITGAGNNAVFSPDGNTIATSSRLSSVEWWNTNTNQSREPEATDDTSAVRASAFSPDGKVLAVGGGWDETDSGVVTLWNAQTHEPLLDSYIRAHPGVGMEVTSLAFSPDSEVFATGGLDKNVELHDAHTGVLIATLEGHTSPVTSVTFSPDGKSIASGDSSGTVNLWSASTHQLLVTLNASSTMIASVAFSENGNTLFTSDDKGEIRIWPAVPRDQVERPSRQPSSGVSRAQQDGAAESDGGLTGAIAGARPRSFIERHHHPEINPGRVKRERMRDGSASRRVSLLSRRVNAGPSS